MIKETDFVMGGVYVYDNESPKGCRGHSYLLHRAVLGVPSYRRKLLVEKLSGRDKGLWFVCSLANFKTRYKLQETGSAGGNGRHEK